MWIWEVSTIYFILFSDCRVILDHQEKGWPGKKKKKKSGGRQPARTGYILQRGHVFGFGVSFGLWVPVIGTDVIFPHLGQPGERRSGYNEPIPLFLKVPGSLFCSNWNSEYAHPQGNELWTRWRLGERGEEFGWWRITTMSVASAWRREPQLSILKNWKSSNSFTQHTIASSSMRFTGINILRLCFLSPYILKHACAAYACFIVSEPFES